MTSEEYNDEIISYLKEENQKLTSEEQSSVSACLKHKGHAPTKQDIAICISEARRKKGMKSKMTEKTYSGPDISTLPPVNRKTVEL